MSEKGKEAGIAVTAEELARINRFAKKELRAEEVYTFAVKLCDNEVDRDFERFDRAALEKLSELFVGRTGIFDHSWSAGGQTARIYRAEVIEEETRTTAGDKYCWCKGWAYMLRTEKNAELIAEIEGGIKKEVSVGCSAAKRSCSICGKDAGSRICQLRQRTTSKSHVLLEASGTPDWIRTSGLQSRSLSLYPTELRAHIGLWVSAIVVK